MSTSERRPSPIVTATMLFVDVSLWLAIPMEMVLVVPKFKRVFDDFALRLPDLTVLVINISRWFVDYWWVAFLPYLALLAGLVAVGLLLRGRSPAAFRNW